MSSGDKIIEKPWGYEELIECNEKYVVKKLFMKADHRCSLQYHEKKHETFYVVSGVLRFTVGETQDSLKDKIMYIGDSFVIPPGLIHRMQAIQDSIYIETSTVELNDVIRLKDDYSR